MAGRANYCGAPLSPRRGSQSAALQLFFPADASRFFSQASSRQCAFSGPSRKIDPSISWKQSGRRRSTLVVHMYRVLCCRHVWRKYRDRRGSGCSSGGLPGYRGVCSRDDTTESLHQPTGQILSAQDVSSFPAAHLNHEHLHHRGAFNFPGCSDTPSSGATLRGRNQFPELLRCVSRSARRAFPKYPYFLYLKVQSCFWGRVSRSRALQWFEHSGVGRSVAKRSAVQRGDNI